MVNIWGDRYDELDLSITQCKHELKHVNSTPLVCIGFILKY
jgi:hypothetical protein